MGKPKKLFSKTISKATSDSSNPPKEKHVRALIGVAQSGNISLINEVVRGLCKRLDKDYWEVVLKALMVFHRCLREGDTAFIESLKDRSGAIFALKRFRAMNPQGYVHSTFILKYAKYLEEQVSVYRLLGFQFENKRDVCKKLTLPSAFKIVSKLQSQLNALLNCKMKQQHIGKSNLILSTFLLLLKDSFILYPILNDGVINLIDMCFSMKKHEVQKVLDIYSLFVRETDALISLYSNMRSFLPNIPNIKRAKTSLIDVLKNQIDKMDDDSEFVSEYESPISSPQTTTNQTTTTSYSYEMDYSEDSEESSTSSSSGDVTQVSRIGSNNSFVSNFGNEYDSWMEFSSQPQQQTTTSQGWDIFDNTSTNESSNMSSNFNDIFNSSTDFETFDGFGFDFQNKSQTVYQQEKKIPIQEEIPYSQRADSVKNLVQQLYHSQSQSSVSENPFLDLNQPISPSNTTTSVNPFLSEHNPFQKDQNSNLKQQSQSYNPFL